MQEGTDLQRLLELTVRHVWEWFVPPPDMEEYYRPPAHLSEYPFALAHLPKVQQYEARCFRACCNCADSLETLKRIERYANAPPPNPTRIRKALALHQWLQYNWQYYVVMYHTVADLASQLTCQVYCLPVKVDGVWPRTVRKNLPSKSPAVLAVQALCTYREQMAPPRARNDLVHSGDKLVLPTVEGRDPGTLRILTEALELNVMVDEFSPKLLHDAWMAYRNACLAPELAAWTRKAAAELDRLACALRPRYLATKRVLEQPES